MKILRKNNIYVFMMISALSVLTSCVSSPSYVSEEDDSLPYYPVYEAGNGNDQGSIFVAGTELALFEDMKASRVGDILTVVLVEQTSGQNSSNNSLNQATGVNLSTPTFGGSARPNLGVTLNSANTFAGDSGSSQSNTLNGSITVTVRQVLANGNLVIQGEKNIRINQGNESIRLQGVIRQKDIDAYNTLYSTQIADARISYTGRGTNAANTEPGWAAKLLFSSLWPF